jgi:hypothetical protein
MSSRIINGAAVPPRSSTPVHAESETTSMHRLNAPLRDELNEYAAHSDQIPSTSWNKVAKLEVNVDSHPLAFRVIVNEPSVRTPSVIVGCADIQSVTSSILEEIVNRMNGLLKRGHESPSLAFAIEKRL